MVTTGGRVGPGYHPPWHRSAVLLRISSGWRRLCLYKAANP